MPDSPPVAVLEANLSGVLVNSMEAFHYPRLYPETMVNVGGMHVAGRTVDNNSFPQVTMNESVGKAYKRI